MVAGILAYFVIPMVPRNKIINGTKLLFQGGRPAIRGARDNIPRVQIKYMCVDSVAVDDSENTEMVCTMADGNGG